MFKRYFALCLLMLPMAAVQGNNNCLGFEAANETAFCEEEETPDRLEILIIEKTTKKPKPRSLVQEVESCFYHSSGTLEFSFNQNIGIVEIIVSGPSGTSTVNCDTQDTYYVTMPVGSASGFYRIDIIGPEYEGTGSFWL